MRCAHA
jgi:hypothetical protein